MSSLVAYIYYDLLRCINTIFEHSSSRQHTRTYLSQFMTSTYLHVNCVVGVACAQAFANTNFAADRLQSYVPKVLYSAGSIFRNMRFYVPKVLYYEGSIFRNNEVKL